MSKDRKPDWVKAREQQMQARTNLKAMWKKLEDAVVKAETPVAGSATKFTRSDHAHTTFNIQWHLPVRPLSWGPGPAPRPWRYTAPAAVTPMKKKLPHIKETLPILAHRAAHLRATVNGIRLFSLAHGPLEIEDDAVCACAYYDLEPSQLPRHPECPADFGTCGFYAVPADIEAQHGSATVDLLVELSGKVVEHEFGYRAQHQRILEVRVQRAHCWLCRNVPTHLRFDSYSDARPVCCGPHDGVADGGYEISFERTSEILGVPVGLMPK
jgi:hypothetical protein